MEKLYSLLVIEDYEPMSSFITKSLEKSPFRIAGIEKTGSGALKAVSRIRPDLILTDIGLEGSMDGVETVERIKDIHSCPVVYLTSHSDQTTLDRAKLTNPYGYIVKPFRPEKLIYTLSIALRQFGNDHGDSENHSKSKKYLFSKELNGMITTDKRAVITSLNPVAEKLTGYMQKDSFGLELRKVFNIANEKSKDVDHDLQEQVKHTDFKSKEAVYTLIDKNGNEKKIAVFAYRRKKSWAKKENIVICFDLLERLSERVNRQIDIKILLHTSNFLRDAITLRIKHEKGIEIIKSNYPHNSELVENIKNKAPDILVLDYGLYDTQANFIRDITVLNQEITDISIIAYFNKINPEVVYKALKAGALGVFHSNSSMNELVPALRNVGKGKIWVDKRLIKNFSAGSRLEKTYPEDLTSKLTKRETEIFTLVIKGESNKTIAEKLSISINTVKNILTSIYSKLEVRGRKEILKSNEN